MIAMGEPLLDASREIEVYALAGIVGDELGARLENTHSADSSWMPKRSKIATVHGRRDSPIWKRGCASFSSRDDIPAIFREQRAAAVDPAGPPPIISTSQDTASSLAGCSSRYWKRAGPYRTPAVVTKKKKNIYRERGGDMSLGRSGVPRHSGAAMRRRRLAKSSASAVPGSPICCVLLWWTMGRMMIQRLLR